MSSRFRHDKRQVANGRRSGKAQIGSDTRGLASFNFGLEGQTVRGLGRLTGYSWPSSEILWSGIGTGASRLLVLFFSFRGIELWYLHGEGSEYLLASVFTVLYITISGEIYSAK